LTQGFFARLLEKSDLERVDRAKGRFRSFLLASLKHYLINEWDKGRAAKRGGGQRKLSFDFSSAESRYSIQPHHEQTAEANFDREWALTMLDQVRSRLAEEQQDAGKGRQYEQLQIYLPGDGGLPPYRHAAQQLGMTEGAVKVAVHRLRRRFGELLREQIRQTISEDEEIDDEIRALFEALRG
jgi:RNA polymerase sigma-70 factor (ECF subfamily)